MNTGRPSPCGVAMMPFLRLESNKPARVSNHLVRLFCWGQWHCPRATSSVSSSAPKASLQQQVELQAQHSVLHAHKTRPTQRPEHGRKAQTITLLRSCTRTGGVKRTFWRSAVRHNPQTGHLVHTAKHTLVKNPKALLLQLRKPCSLLQIPSATRLNT
jgi:hypothetical protein